MPPLALVLTKGNDNGNNMSGDICIGDNILEIRSEDKKIVWEIEEETSWSSLGATRPRPQFGCPASSPF